MDTTEATKKIKQKLQDELNAALQTLQKLDARLEEHPDTGLGEGGTGVYSWEMALARRERTRHRIDELQMTLGRIDKGNFGICEICGQAINPDRLEILPTTVHCASCASNLNQKSE
jgi:RNA polymerase-binding transcription factor DksA